MPSVRVPLGADVSAPECGDCGHAKGMHAETLRLVPGARGIAWCRHGDCMCRGYTIDAPSDSPARSSRDVRYVPLGPIEFDAEHLGGRFEFPTWRACIVERLRLFPALPVVVERLEVNGSGAVIERPPSDLAPLPSLRLAVGETLAIVVRLNLTPPHSVKPKLACVLGVRWIGG